LFSTINHYLTARNTVFLLNKKAPKPAYEFPEFYGTQNAYSSEQHTHTSFLQPCQNITRPCIICKNPL